MPSIAAKSRARSFGSVENGRSPPADHFVVLNRLAKTPGNLLSHIRQKVVDAGSEFPLSSYPRLASIIRVTSGRKILRNG